MTRFAILASTAMLVWDLASAQPLQAFGGNSGSGDFRITIDITDAVAPQVQPTDQTQAASTAQVMQNAEEEPPLPSAEASATPKTLAEHFCRMWRAEDYKAMYCCMSKRYRSQVELVRFADSFAKDVERTGGLDSWIVVAEDPENAVGPLLLIDLKFMKRKMPTRRVKAVFEKTKDGYRLVKSGILPVDFNNL